MKRQRQRKKPTERLTPPNTVTIGPRTMALWKLMLGGAATALGAWLLTASVAGLVHIRQNYALIENIVDVEIAMHGKQAPWIYRKLGRNQTESVNQTKGETQ